MLINHLSVAHHRLARIIDIALMVVLVAAIATTGITTAYAADPPDLISPTDGATTSVNNPTFAWGDVTGAMQYQIQIDNDVDFSSPINGISNTSNYTPVSGLVDGVYHWHVKTLSANESSVYGAVWTVTIDTPPGATITVNETADELNTDGGCSLREAMTNANNDNQSGSTDCAAGSGADTIIFSVTGTITLSSTLPTVTSIMTIDGAGQAVSVSGNNAVRVFFVEDTGNLTLNAITVRDGKAPADLDAGGGILNRGLLTVTNSTLSSNSASSGGGISNSDIGNVIVDASTVSDNAASSGSGITNAGSMTVSNSTISGNAATNDGGGIKDSYGPLTVTNSTISNNSAGRHGGGIYNNAGDLTVINNTFSGNTAVTEGSSIFITGMATVRTVQLAATVLNMGTHGANCYGELFAIVDNGYNLSDDASCGFSSTGSQNNATLNLGALADNGGPTQTHLPGTGSAAIDLIPNGTTVNNNGVTYTCNQTGELLDTDQRSQPRPVIAAGKCDAGAVEAVDLPPAPTAPTLLSPADGTISDNIPTFDWGDVIGATQYQIQVDNDASFTSPEIETTTTLSTYTPTTALADRIYYWHVRSGNGLWSSYSSVSTVEINAVPPAPTLLSPANGSTIAEYDPTFDWTDVAGAVQHRLQVDDDADFSSPVADNLMSDMSIYRHLLLVDGTYYWRVKVRTDADGWSVYSDVWSVTIETHFEAPTNLTAAVANRIDVNLSWSDNSWDETGFNIERSVNGVTGWKEIAKTAENVTTYQDKELACMATYYYRVRADRGLGDHPAGHTEYSNIASVLTGDCQAGNLDATFGDNGIVISDVVMDSGAAVLQPDGKIVVVGSYGGDAAIARYHPDGTLDASFSEDGIDIFPSGALWTSFEAVTLQPDGKIVAAGFYEADINHMKFMVARYHPDGTLDSSFGASGITVTEVAGGDMARSVAIQPDGKIVLAGVASINTASDAVVIRYDSNGTLDASFGVEGVVITTVADKRYNEFRDMVIHPDGKIIAAGYAYEPHPSFILCRYNADGSLDTAFGTDGIVITNFGTDRSDYIEAIALQLDGKVVAVGRSSAGVYDYFALARYNQDGSLDPFFGVDGKVLTSMGDTFWGNVNAVTVQPDGRIIVAGSSSLGENNPSNLTLARYDVDGSLDMSFSDDGIVRTVVGKDSWGEPADVILLPDGKVITVGAHCEYEIIYPFLARYFATSLPAAPILIAPANGSTTGDNTPTFDWGDVIGATQYQIQIDDSSTFASPLVDATPDTSTYTPAMGLANKAYYWRARAQDAAGNWSAYSAAWRVTIDATPPATPVLSSPANGASVRGTPTYIWLASSTATRYQFRYGTTDCSDANAVHTSDELTTTRYKPPAQALNTLYHWCVRARDAVENWSAWSTPRTITILPLIPAAPALDEPISAWFTSDNTPEFSWSGVPDGNTYEIQIDKQSTFTAPLEQTHTGGVAELTYTADPALPDGRYYWRVRAYNISDEPGAWSAVRSFTVDTLAPTAPTLNAPKDKARVAAKPTLSVLAVTGAKQYQFQVSPDPLFGTIPVDATRTTTSYTLTTALGYGRYYWRAQTIDAAGNPSGWSAVRSFSVTIQTAPADGASLTKITPTFTWAAISGAQAYHLQVDESDAFSSPEVDREDLKGTSFVSPAMDYGIHYWRMRVRVADVWGEWMPAWQFTVTPTIPPAPTLSSPANAAVLNDSTPTLTWNAVAGDDNTYQVQVDNQSAFTSPERAFTSGAGEISYTVDPALSTGVYYWRVRTHNYLGVPSAWSAVRRFMVDVAAPLPPVLSKPADTAPVVGTPTYVWLAASTAVRYRLSYDNTDCGGTNADYTSPELTTTSHKPPTQPSGVYLWCARARDAAGNWSNWSNPRTVTIQPLKPAAPVLVAPINALVTTNQALIVLSWNSVPYGSTYEVQTDRLSTFTSLDLMTHTSAVDELSYMLDPTALSGVYYWRVRAVNANSAAGAWSAARSFTIDAAAPLPPVLRSPADADQVVGTPTYTWLASTTAVRYKFRYGINNCSEANKIYTSAELATTSHKPPTQDPGTYAWCTQARDAAGNWSGWSETRTVTVQPLKPAAPVLVAPINALITTNQAPIVLSWKSVPYGSTYEVQIGRNSTFATLVQNPSGIVDLSYSFDPTGLSGLHYWRVRAVNANSAAGAWSAVRSLTIDAAAPLPPVLSAPANGATVTGTPTYSWLAAATATRYKFRYGSPDCSDANEVYTSAELTVRTHKPPTQLPGAYAWCAQARDAAGNWSDWSAPRTVTVQPLVPAVPAPASPANGSISPDPAPTLTWNAVPYGMTYQVEVDNNSTFSSKEFEGTSATNSITTTPLAGGDDSPIVYYWRVRAYNDPAGTPSAWSAVWRVTIDQPIPAAPVLTSPADASTETTGTPTFSWESAANAAAYQLQVDDDALFGSPEFDDTADTTSRTPTAPLADGAYSWRVRAINVYGMPGEWSVVRTMTVSVPPAAPNLLSPANASIETTGIPTFSWESVENGATYQIQVDDSADFTSPEFDDTANSTSRTPLTPLDNSDDGPIVYFWRVRAINILGTPGEWSAAWTLTVRVPFTPPPDPPNLVVESFQLVNPASADAMTAGTPITFSAMVKNLGDASLPEGSADLNLYYSTTDLGTASPLVDATPGSSYTGNVHVTGPAGSSGPYALQTTLPTPGTYWIYAWVDDTDKIPEGGLNPPDPTREQDNVAVLGPYTVKGEADLQAESKTPSAMVVQVGDPFDYVVRIRNSSSGTADNVYVTDPLPAVLEFVSADNGGTFGGANVNWGPFTLAAGESRDLHVTVRVKTGTAANTRFTNMATVSTTSAIVVDNNTSNNTVLAPEVTVGGFDLVVTKTVDKSEVNVGDVVNFTVTVKNNGNLSPVVTVTSLTLTDTWPSQITYTGTSVSGCTPTSCTVTDLAQGASFTVVFSGTVLSLPPGLDVINTATVAAASVVSSPSTPETDPTTNNTATATVTAPVTDLALEKTVSPSTTMPGDVVTYTLSVTNQGPTRTENRTVEDIDLYARIASGFFEIVSESATQGTLNSNGLWEGISLNAGESATATIQVRVIGTGVSEQVSNTAVIVSEPTQPDPVVSNNMDTALLAIQWPEPLFVNAGAYSCGSQQWDGEPGDGIPANTTWLASPTYSPGNWGLLDGTTEVLSDTNTYFIRASDPPYTQVSGAAQALMGCYVEGSDFFYRFDSGSGIANGTYQVTLLFAEPNTVAGERVMDISANGILMWNNIDPIFSDHAPYHDVRIPILVRYVHYAVHRFNAVVTDHLLVLRFTDVGGPKQALVNGVGLLYLSAN